MQRLYRAKNRICPKIGHAGLSPRGLFFLPLPMVKFPFPQVVSLLGLTLAACALATPTPTPTPLPTATPRPTPVIIGTTELLGTTDPQEIALWQAWRGLDENDQLYPFGVSLKNVQDQSLLVKSTDSDNVAANWLLDRLKQCQTDYNTMIVGDYTNPAEAATIIASSTNVITQCNPRVFEAYGHRRWAELALWTAPVTVDETKASQMLAGLVIGIGRKRNGSLPWPRPDDQIAVNVEAVPEFRLSEFYFVLSRHTLDLLFGSGQWQEESAAVFSVPGNFLPYNPPEPLLPVNAQATPTP